jgi:hypothetical protein
LRVREHGQRLAQPQRCDGQQGDEHRRAEPVNASAPAIPRHAVAENDVEHEERAIGKGKDEAKRLPAESHVGEKRATGQRQTERQEIAPGADADRRQNDLAEKLDSADCTERQARDGEIEAGVHQSQDDAHSDEQTTLSRFPRAKLTPGTPPDREDDRRAGDTQPRHPKHADVREEQHCEGGAEIVKDGAHDKIGVRRNSGQVGSIAVLLVYHVYSCESVRPNMIE